MLIVENEKQGWVSGLVAVVQLGDTLIPCWVTGSCLNSAPFQLPAGPVLRGRGAWLKYLSLPPPREACVESLAPSLGLAQQKPLKAFGSKQGGRCLSVSLPFKYFFYEEKLNGVERESPVIAAHH